MADYESPPPGLEEAIANEPALTQEPPEQPQVNDPNLVPKGTDNAPLGLNDAINQEMKESVYGTPGQTAIASAEALGRGVLGPIAPALERAAGINPQGILARKEVNPVPNFAFETAGLLGSGAVGKGLGAVLGTVGKVAEGAAVAQGLGKIGSAAVKGALETMVFQGQDEVSKLILGDPNQHAESALANIGLAGALGGVIGGSFGAVNPLWKSLKSTKMGGLLKAVANKAGGIEGVVSGPVNEAIDRAGIDIAPEVRAGLSEDPHVQEMFTTLNQSDTTESGKSLQQSYNTFRKQAGDAVISALGKSPDDIATLQGLSKYEAGKNIGNTLAREYESQVNPISKTFDDLKTKFKDMPLDESVTKPEEGSSIDKAITSGYAPPDVEKIPSTTDGIVDKISNLAIKEGWTASPSSDIMREVNRVIKEIPLQKNVKNLGDYITQLQNNTMSDPLNGSLRRAGGMMSSILKDAEADVIGSRLGATEGPEAVARFADARAAYRDQSTLKEALDSRLGIRGSTSGFAKGIKEAAQTDGEGLLRKLTTKNDADLIPFLQKNYPETAKLVRDYHVNDLLKGASDKAKDGFNINTEHLIKNLSKLSPELKQFIADPQTLNKISAIGEIVDKFNSLPHNFSNTARTLDKLMKHVPGTAIGMGTAVHSHNPVMGAIVGALTHTVGKEIPDAVKLSLLRFLGSSVPVDAEGFQAMTHTVNSAMKTEALVNKAAKNVFKKDADVIPIGSKSSESDRNLLDKSVRTLQNSPNKFLEMKNKAAYYMPEVGTATAKVMATAVSYLNSQRSPEAPSNPLDTKPVQSQAQLAMYNRTLDNVQAPLNILSKVKDGSITPKDVQDMSAVYPALYQRLQQKIMQELISAKSKDIAIPYSTRVGLSIFMSQPMDSTMTPQGIQAIMMTNPNNKGPGAQGPQDAGSQKGSLKAVGKMSDTYRTPSQVSEQRRSRIK